MSKIKWDEVAEGDEPTDPPVGCTAEGPGSHEWFLTIEEGAMTQFR